jgi:hypothetical protein
METCSGLRSAAPIWMRTDGVDQPRFPRERPLHVLEAAVSDGTQENGNGLVGWQRGRGKIGLPEMIDMGLQLAPTREAVLPSDGELRFRKLRLATLQTHVAQMLLGSFAQPVEICPNGQGVSHGTPSFR